jgi:hypothetical protein
MPIGTLIAATSSTVTNGAYKNWSREEAIAAYKRAIRFGGRAASFRSRSFMILFYFACYCAVVSTFMLIICICCIPIFLIHPPHQRIRWKIHWMWFDFWMGLYYDKRKEVIWFCPFPMLALRIWFEDK